MKIWVKIKKLKLFQILKSIQQPTSKHTIEHKRTQAIKMTDETYIWTIIEGHRAELNEDGELIDYFRVNPNYYHSGGRTYYLKNREKKQKYYLENKERIDKVHQAWVLKNKEAVKEYMADYSKTHVEDIRRNARKYYEKNKEKEVQRQKKLYEEKSKKVWLCPHCGHEGTHASRYYHLNKSKCAKERTEAESPPKKVKKYKLRIVGRADPPVINEP